MFSFVLRISLRNDSVGTMRLGAQYSWVLDSLGKCVEYMLKAKDSIRNENDAHLPCSSLSPKAKRKLHGELSLGPADRNPTQTQTQTHSAPSILPPNHPLFYRLPFRVFRLY